MGELSDVDNFKYLRYFCILRCTEVGDKSLRMR